jgi:hypothetical protein
MREKHHEAQLANTRAMGKEQATPVIGMVSAHHPLLLRSDLLFCEP